VVYFKNFRKNVLVSLIASLLLLGCQTKEPQVTGEQEPRSLPAVARQYIEIDGSSTVFPIPDSIPNKFRQSAENVKLTVRISGTKGGFKLFCTGQTAINDASPQITSAEMELCRKTEVSFL
jgi:phosphate transport system substrate-binding protein